MKKNFFTKVFSPIALLTRDYSEDFEEFASAKIERTSSNEPETITQVLNLHTFFFFGEYKSTFFRSVLFRV